MTHYLPLLLCFAGCQTADGSAGLIGPPGPQGAAGEPGAKGDKGDPAPAAKQLHLINTDTGEDLGLFVTFGSAWSEKMGGLVYYNYRAGISYSDPGCKGTTMMLASNLQRHSSYIPGPTGTFLRPMMRATAKFHQKSWADWADGRPHCNESEADVSVVPYSDTGLRATVLSDDVLDVELR